MAQIQRRLPGAFLLWFLTLVTLGIYSWVYVARRVKEGFETLDRTQEELATMKEMLNRIDARGGS